MGEAKRRRDSVLISVLIPERGRPEMLERLICSLIDTAGTDERYEILVQIDDDDPEWVDRDPLMHSRTRYIRRPRPITLGEKLNELAKISTGEIIFFISNDQIVTTHGWPGKFREAISKLPNNIGIPFVKDPLHPDHASYPVFHRSLVEAVGFAFAPWFPAWFIDTWADQIGILTGLRFEIDVEVASPDGRGKCHALRDITFWATFFNETLPMRLRDAIHLLTIAYGEGTPEFNSAMKGIEQRQMLCAARTRHLATPEFAEVWERNTESEPGPSYEHVKGYAEKLLDRLRKESPRRPRVAICCPSGRTWEATTANCIAALAAYSTRGNVELAFLNVQSSQISHGRNTSVKIAMQENCDYILFIDSDMKFEPTILLDLMKHEKDIVGATYNRRVPPYQTLGLLKGPKPEDSELRGGLREALLLPGGLILIKMDVFRAIGMPFYAETYYWPGADGLESLKGLLRDYFRESPPEEVLADLDNTKLGDWIKTGYDLSEKGGEKNFETFSEDLFFCRKVRKHGYQVWCCLDTTFSTCHLGTIEVDCKLPDTFTSMGNVEVG